MGEKIRNLYYIVHTNMSIWEYACTFFSYIYFNNERIQPCIWKIFCCTSKCVECVMGRCQPMLHALLCIHTTTKHNHMLASSIWIMLLQCSRERISPHTLCTRQQMDRPRRTSPMDPPSERYPWHEMQRQTALPRYPKQQHCSNHDTHMLAGSQGVDRSLSGEASFTYVSLDTHIWLVFVHIFT